MPVAICSNRINGSGSSDPPVTQGPRNQTNGAVVGSVVNGTGQTNFVLFDPNGCLLPRAPTPA